MILAGIDEAGYGPLLGPLVVGCCAFEINAPPNPLPCLWQALRPIVTKTRDRTGRKLHINDSKIVYSPSTGLKELERSILCLLTASTGPLDDLSAVLSRVADHVVLELQEYPWYAPPPDERFPLQQDAISLRLMSNALNLAMHQARIRCVHLAARVIPERRLNVLLDQTHNKASVLFSQAAIHLDHLLRNFGQQNLVIFCDRQGGREHYGHLLRLMFEDWSLTVVAETDGQCEYHLTRQSHTVRLLFREKAETQCMSVAVASMLCKYLREALMRRFNYWWRSALPDLHPTAGYYTDGLRFLRDIDAKRRELGIEDMQLIRSR
jgi:hypothetical protein